ncbi:hypothetical protein GE21DRAFT_1332061 [Neurospora crassa]|nr:hypothetical protein GE21DRAFT_1332061 [Neurospora crassa]
MLGTWVMTNAAGKGDNLKWKLSQTEAQQCPPQHRPRPSSNSTRAKPSLRQVALDQVRKPKRAHTEARQFTVLVPKSSDIVDCDPDSREARLCLQ